MNKGMSGDPSKILAVQGVGWVKRKALSMGTVTTIMRHFKDEQGVERIRVDSTLASHPVSTEERILDWTERSREDPLAGPVVARMRRVAPSELEFDFLKTGWTADTLEHGLIHLNVEPGPGNKNRWSVNQTYGIQEINGERRYVAHSKITTPSGEGHEILLVYDYLGPLEA
ncbi:hypothetical protein FB45DRAFT_835538 [Roridomyces roridus]|uniref:Uncharacterized protein n=1 Tax=Roridomyces roridus TaxID=1738132 RepID=A0AAD7BQ21_9AGAR|nr:hypothetical protein FB45DRAFT_835538 [Roridomyces roridus]